jgi:hypothetical protein
MKADLNVAVNARGRHYAYQSALIVFWEEDDTLANRDAEALKAVLTDCFGISSLVYKIEANDKTPAWNLRKKIHDRINSLHPPHKPGQSLCVFAYIGHGRIEEDELYMCSGSGKEFGWATVKEPLFEYADLQFVKQIPLRNDVANNWYPQAVELDIAQQTTILSKLLHPSSMSLMR